MRNFKKFLALVLAMLMVSACAVSVSAYGDQAAVNASGYAEAIEMLTKLGVVQGDDKGNYNPNNTLRRDEAAVIIAKLVAGVTPVEWTAETTKFDDVDAKWSFAYINYVADRKIMIGTDKGFEPTRELQIDEALALALKATSPSKLREVEIETAQFPTNYWADYYISAADELGLTDKLGTIYDYEAACSRAMFAQIAVNMLNYSYTEGTGNNAVVVAPIGDGFGYASELALVANVDATNGNVTLTSLVEGRTIPTIKLDAFNAALKDAGYEKTAADLVNYKVSMQWSTKTFAIYEVEVLTSVDTFTYATEAIKYVPTAADANVPEAAKLEINGKVYDINSDDRAAGNVTEIGGSATADTNNIRVYLDGSANEITNVTTTTIPAFYAVDCYDDNGDGDYERAYITTYYLVTLTKGEKVDHDGKNTTATIESTIVNRFTATGADPESFVGARYLTVDGAAFTAWGETPVLMTYPVIDQTEGTCQMSAKILETAKTVTGDVSGFKADKYITINGGDVKFAAGYIDLQNWVLGQKVTIYTIGGKYVSVASADTGVESGMTSKTVIVDNVVIDNGKAVVSGFVKDATFAPITLTVVGVEDAGKLVARNAYLNDKDINNDGVVDATDVIPDYNKDTKNDDADRAFAAVALGTAKDDKGVIANKVIFQDNTAYTFRITSAGAYVVPTSAAAFVGYTNVQTDNEVKVDGSLIKVTIDSAASAKYRLESSYVVVTKTDITNTNDKAYNYYSLISYTSEANAKLPANTTLTYAVADKNDVGFGSSDALSKNVALIYVTGKANASTNKVVNGLDGLTIVKLLNEESVSLEYNTYNAIDIFTGEAVQVTGNVTIDTTKPYATVDADGKIVANKTQWIDELDVTVNVVLGKVDSVTAYTTYLEGTTEKVGDGETGTSLKQYTTGDANKVTIGVDAIIWKLDGDKLVADTEYEFEVDQTKIYGFINGGKVVILPSAE